MNQLSLWISVVAAGGLLSALMLTRLRAPKARPLPPRGTRYIPPTEAVQPIAVPPPEPPPRGALIVLSGAQSAQRVAIGRSELTIGKGSATLQILDDPTVSTVHARIYDDHGAVALMDLGSTNGTFVNEVRVTETVRLKDGDTIRFGRTTTKFRVS